MADVIDFKIYGDDLQMVEIELDPGEAVRAEVGTMTYLEDGIEMATSTGGGLLKGLGRAITGESFFITSFTNTGRENCRTWAVHQRYTRPYRPQTNGKAERLIPTLLREWAYRVPYSSSARRTAALSPYLRFYNHRRPHASLGRRSPWMRFQEAA